MDYGRLGKPSLVFGEGQKRRLSMIREHVDLESRKVLDFGCGVGVYSQRMAAEGAEVWGVDVDEEVLEKARAEYDIPRFLRVGDTLPFEEGFFDVVLFNEVLEHVGDDKKAVEEGLRVLKPGGVMVIFVPNKWFPFETHGMYLGERYVFGNIPLLSWAPRPVRRVLSPHVRIYTQRKLLSLFEESVEVAERRFVYPAFDKVGRRWPFLGRLLKRIGLWAESNPLFKRFGISIFLVVRKKN